MIFYKKCKKNFYEGLNAIDAILLQLFDKIKEKLKLCKECEAAKQSAKQKRKEARPRRCLARFVISQGPDNPKYAIFFISSNRINYGRVYLNCPQKTL